MSIHLKNYANELEESGYPVDAKYVRERLMPLLDEDLIAYNIRGKHKLAKLIAKNDKEQNV